MRKKNQIKRFIVAFYKYVHGGIEDYFYNASLIFNCVAKAWPTGWQSDNLIIVSEWLNGANFLSCVKRLETK